VDARRRAIQNAPQVLFRNEPPLELQNVQNLGNERDDKVGYVTFGNPANLRLLSFLHSYST
jgi:actin related protein 2/3 complex, subunit 2